MGLLSQVRLKQPTARSLSGKNLPQNEAPQDGEVPQDNGQGGPGGQSQGIDSYTAANEYTEDTTVSNEKLESTGQTKTQSSFSLEQM